MCNREMVWDQTLSLSCPEHLVIIRASPPWLWLYFIFISSGLVSSAVGDPLSGQDIRLGHQKCGFCLTSDALGKVLTGKGPSGLPSLFLTSVLIRRFLITSRLWFLFSLLAFVCAVPSTRNTLFFLALPLQTFCILPGGLSSHNWPFLYQGSHCALSTVSTVTLWTSLFMGIIFCLLIVSIWVSSFQMRQELLPLWHLLPLYSSWLRHGPLTKPASIEVATAALLEDSQLDG